MEHKLYPFQEDSVSQLLGGKHFTISGTGSGKSAIAVSWAEKKCRETGKRKVLVVTTASKARTDDFANETTAWWSPNSLSSLSLEVISWHKLAAWTKQNLVNAEDYVIIWDEVQKAGAGASSQMGKAFLKITARNKDWAAFTATPGDTWLKFYPYFVACGLVKNKTSFMSKYAKVQTFKGFPEIVGWEKEHELRWMWGQISYAPDTSIVAQQMPSETYNTIRFSLPRDYSKVLKTRFRAGSDGSNYDDFLATPGALVAELRRLCFTKQKQEWLADFIEGLESSVVLFYNYTATGDALERLAKKALPKGGKVWRIDGGHHDIPNAETIGEKDVVICQWQSGSEALNLQFIHYWVGVELCYSYSTFVQGLGRIKRIGQNHPMSFYALVCEKGIEQDVLNTLRRKGEFSIENWCIEKKIIRKKKESD